MQKESHFGPIISLLKNLYKEYKERLAGPVYQKWMVREKVPPEEDPWKHSQLSLHTDAAGHPQGCCTEPGDLEKSTGLGTSTPRDLGSEPGAMSLSVAFEVLLRILIRSASYQVTVSLVTLLDSIFW